jgi:hypothetical protein
MKEKPILFSTPMVHAILDDRKTKTRRVVKHQDCVEFDKEGAIYVHHPKCPSYCDYGCNGVGFGESPYGLKGNHLWVRETHYRYGHWTKNGKTKTGRQKYKFCGNDDGLINLVYDLAENLIEKDKKKTGWFKRPSIFMPRWASRTILEISNVRVERLQEITEEDAIKEGLLNDEINQITAIENFENLWEQINGKKYPWSSNPWVWVIEFKRLEQ